MPQLTINARSTQLFLYGPLGVSSASSTRIRFSVPHRSRKAALIAFKQSLGVEVPWDKPDLSRSERVEAFLQDLTIGSSKDAGQKLRLRSFQRDFIHAVYREDKNRQTAGANGGVLAAAKAGQNASGGGAGACAHYRQKSKIQNLGGVRRDKAAHSRYVQPKADLAWAGGLGDRHAFCVRSSRPGDVRDKIICPLTLIADPDLHVRPRTRNFFPENSSTETKRFPVEGKNFPCQGHR